MSELALPPPSDGKKCRAQRKDGGDCDAYALPGSDFCHFHDKCRVKGPGFYLSRVSENIAARLEEILSTPVKQQLQLYEEIAVARLAALQAVKAATPFLEGDPRVTPQLAALMQENLRRALSDVTMIVEKAAKIEANFHDKVSVNVISMVMMQVTREIHDTLGRQHPDLAAALDQRIQKSVMLPVSEDAESVISRDSKRTVDEMDAVTSPSAPEETVDVAEAVQNRSGGQAVGKNGTSKASFGPSLEGDETVE